MDRFYIFCGSFQTTDEASLNLHMTKHNLEKSRLCTNKCPDSLNPIDYIVLTRMILFLWDIIVQLLWIRLSQRL